MQNIIVHCDGASRGNPGKAACGFVILKDGIEVVKHGKTLGVATNNVAEYWAVVEALTWFVENKKTESRVNLVLDSLLVVNQLKGLYKIKNKDLLKLATRVKILEKSISAGVTYTSVPREKNKIADTLVNQILDGQILG